MRAGAIVCFILAGIATVAAIRNVVGGADPPEAFEYLVGYVVGSFLLPVMLLIGGLVLWGRAGKS